MTQPLACDHHPRLERALPEQPPGHTPPEPTPIVPPPYRPQDPSVPQYAYPPPYGQPPQYLPSAPPPRRRGLLAAIIGGGLVVLAGIVVGVVAIASALSGLVSDIPSPFGGRDLVSGEAGSPLAAEPVECPDVCFGNDISGETIVSEHLLGELGTTDSVESWGDYATSTGVGDYDYMHVDWNRVKGTPDGCFFTYLGSPIAATVDDRPEDGDFIDYTGSNATPEGISSIDQTVRVFATSDDAVQHMVALDGLLPGCEHYEFGKGDDSWEAEVTPAPALDVPSSVAAVGWRETNGTSRYYVFDLQYSNLVVRSILSTDGEITEEQFRAFIEEYAVELSELSPLGISDSGERGDASGPYAVNPTLCDDDCFSYNALNLAYPSKGELDQVGLTVDELDAPPPTSIETQKVLDSRSWEVAYGTPSQCFVTWSIAPMTGVATTASGPLYFDGSHTDKLGDTRFDQTVRLFPNSATAVDYMVQLDSELTLCTEYTTTTQNADDVSRTDVNAAAALPVPDNIAVVGWVEESESGTRYVFDLQRGNFVVRTTLHSDGGMTEAEFRTLMLSIADRMSTMAFD
jgi:hypothetical protein